MYRTVPAGDSDSNQQSSNDLPRVHVDSLHNWLRVRRMLTESANDALDAHLASAPGSSKQKDRDRAAYAAHLNAFIARTFDIAKPNLRVNGRNYDEFEEELEDEETEPFDEALDRQIHSLSDQRLRWDNDIAKKRREMPTEVEGLMRDIIARQRAADEDHDEDETGENGGPDMLEDDPMDDRYAQIEAVFNETTALTTALATSVPVEHERAGRVKTVTREMKALK